MFYKQVAQLFTTGREIKQLQFIFVYVTMGDRTYIFLFILLIPSYVAGQAYTLIGEEELLALTDNKNDSTYVVNFWATWCSPCVREIGYFEEIHRGNQDEKLKVILVSLDFPDKAEKQLPAFLEEKEITAQVMLMSDVRYNEWIDQVDPTWSGAIPATLIYNSKKRIFLEKELSREELLKYVKQIHN